MGSMGIDSGSQQNNPMEQFLILAKSAKGAAACQLVLQAVKAPNVFVFSELLSCANIGELANGDEEPKKHYRLLQLFSCGVYSDYIQNKDQFPVLDEMMILKLRQLTIITMADKDRIIPYSQLLEALGMGEVRGVEDVIIDAVYKRVLEGKLDQQNQCLHVLQWTGRDIGESALDSMMNTLTAWCTQCHNLLQTLESQISIANHNKGAHIQQNKSTEEEFANLKKAQKVAAGQSGRKTPDLDDVPSEVSSSREPEKKLQKTRGKVRGTSKQWTGRNN